MFIVCQKLCLLGIKISNFPQGFGETAKMATAVTPDDYIAELRANFKWADYLVFGIVLAISAMIGIFHGFFAKTAKNNDEFLMGISLQITCSGSFVCKLKQR